jgi:AraC-like DNA-binding protein
MTFESDDIVDTGATENTAAEVETEQTEWQPESEAQEPEQQETEQKEESEQEEKPKRNRAQERIQQLAREKAEMAAKLAEYEAKVNQPVQASERPNIADFDDINDYYKAVDEYQIDQAVQAGLQRDLPMPLTLDEVASEFGYSPETQVKLLYEIGKNEALHETLSSSSKLKAARILSEIVDSWETKPAPKVSKAPPPIKPVQANAPAARSPEKMSDDEWYRAETQLRKR